MLSCKKIDSWYANSYSSDYYVIRKFMQLEEADYPQLIVYSIAYRRSTMELQESYKTISIEKQDSMAFYRELPLVHGEEWKSFSTIAEALYSVMEDDYGTYVY